MPDDVNLPVPPVVPTVPPPLSGADAVTPPTDIPPITPPPPPPIEIPEPVTPAVTEESAYGTPPSEADLKAAEAKAQELVGGAPLSGTGGPAPKVGKKWSLGPTLKIGGAVLALAIFVIGGGVATNLVQIPGVGETRELASEGDGSCDGALNGIIQCNTGLCQAFKCVDGNWVRADSNATCDQHPACQDGTPDNEPPPDNQCPNGSGPIVSCRSYNCPEGDPDGDGQCKSNERGGSRTNCPAPECGQIDYDDASGNYCGHIYTGGFPNCSGGGGDGDTPPPDDTPTPSHAPPEGLVCKNLRANPESPKMGEAVRFICRSDGTKKVNHFEFRYKVDKGEWQDLPNGTAEGIEGKDRQFRGTSDLTITQAGDYKVQCRVCKRADGNCTDWGKAH